MWVDYRGPLGTVQVTQAPNKRPLSQVATQDEDWNSVLYTPHTCKSSLKELGYTQDTHTQRNTGDEKRRSHHQDSGDSAVTDQISTKPIL